jgi:hypothetical protein
MLMVLEFKNDMKITQKYVRSTARSAIHWLFDISAKALEIWAVKSPKCIVWCAVDCTYGQQHDRLIITVKYCQSNIYGEVNRVKKYWWCLTILYSLTWCWLYLRVNHCTERKSYTHSHQVTNININIKIWGGGSTGPFWHSVILQAKNFIWKILVPWVFRNMARFFIFMVRLYIPLTLYTLRDSRGISDIPPRHLRFTKIS